MSTSTEVVWQVGTPSSTDQSAIHVQAETMASEGKTDNVAVDQLNVPEVGQLTVTRTWTTTADAEEWVAFILTYNPISAEITT